MARTKYIQTNFTAGELSPRLDARIDLTKYQNGAKTLENMFIFPHGGTQRRGGTKFITQTKTAADKVRLVPFEFSTTQAYILEFGDEYIRFYRDNGAILEASKTITGITQANPAVVTSNSHGYNNGDWVYISAVVGMTEVNGSYYIVAGKTTNTFQLTDLDGNNINSSAFTAYGSAGTAERVYTVTTPWDKDDLFELSFTQSADILYVVHPNYSPRQVSRTGHTSWTVTEYEFIDGPYLAENTTDTTLALSGTSGSVTVTASAVTGINGDAGFRAADVGRLIRYTHSGTTTYLKVTAFTDTTHVTATVTGDNSGGTSGVTTWRLGYYYTNNQPSTVAFYEQRLVFGGSNDYPQLMVFSASGDYTNHAPGTSADDPMVYTIATDQVNVIRWLNPGLVLVVGTVGGEFVVSASSQDEALTPTNIRVIRQTTYGSADISALRVSNVVLFVQRAKRKIREFVYRFESDTYVAPDLTLLAEHITSTGIVQLAYQQEPDSILWACLTDGTLLGMTYQRDQDVVAWHSHTIGGVSDTADTKAQVESIAVIPTTATDGAGRDQLWLSVKRLINGNTYRYIEVLQPGLEVEDSQEDAFFVDSGLTLDSPKTITAATRAKPVVITSSSHGFSDGDLVDIRDVKGMTELNNKRFVVIESTTNTFEIMAQSKTTVTAATKANPCVITSASHGLSTGNEIGFLNVGGMTQLNGNGYTVTKISNDTFSIGVDSSGYGTFTSGGDIHLNTDGSAFTTYVSGGKAREAVSTISGLDHLEGQSLSVLGNGAVQASQTVSSGSITLATRASIVHMGLPYTSTLVTMNLEAAANDGTAQSRTKRIHEVFVRFYRSLGVKVGSENGYLDIIPFRDSSDLMDSPPALFTGEKKVAFPKGYETEGRVKIVQEQPLPMTLLAIIMHVKTNE